VTGGRDGIIHFLPHLSSEVTDGGGRHIGKHKKAAPHERERRQPKRNFMAPVASYTGFDSFLSAALATALPARTASKSL
jgi:hypothetical protein